MVPHFPVGKVTGPLTDEEPGCQEPAFQNWDRAPKLALLPSFCFPGHRSAPGQRSKGDSARVGSLCFITYGLPHASWTVCAGYHSAAEFKKEETTSLKDWSSTLLHQVKS